MSCINCAAAASNKESGLCDDCEKTEQQKINGLLYLPALGLVLGLIGEVLSLFSYAGMIFTHYKNSGIVTYYSAGILLFSLAGLLLTLLACWFFFRRKKKTRSVMITLYLFNLICALYFTLLPQKLFHIPLGKDDIRLLAGAIITVVIWVPYFIFSKRVPQVFSR